MFGNLSSQPFYSFFSFLDKLFRITNDWRFVNKYSMFCFVLFFNRNVTVSGLESNVTRYDICNFRFIFFIVMLAKPNEVLQELHVFKEPQNLYFPYPRHSSYKLNNIGFPKSSDWSDTRVKSDPIISTSELLMS